MAMYTVIVGNFIIKPEFINFVKWVTHDGKTKGHWEFDWQFLKKHPSIKNHPDFKCLLKKTRHDSIGFKGTGTFDEIVDEIDIIGAAGRIEKGITFERDDRMITVFSDIPNERSEINAFVSIMPLIAEWWEFFSLYEEFKYDLEPDRHISVQENGRVVNHTIKGQPHDHGNGFY